LHQVIIKTQNVKHKTQNPKSKIQNPKSETWLLSATQIWGLLLLTLHLAAINLPEESSWSLWPYTFLPSWLGWTLGLLVGALIIPALNDKVSAGIGWLWRVWPAKEARWQWFTLASLLAGLVFWLARLRHLRWGDSYLLSVALSYPDLELRVIYNWQAPLTVFLHQRLWQFVADPLLGWPVENVYATLSIISGMVFVYVLLTFTFRLGRNPLEATILTGLVLTTGAMQLFFGYVENYTIVSVGLLITLFLAWRTLQGETRLVWPVLAMSVTNAFHPSTVFLWPGIWLLSWLCWQRGRVSLTSGLWQTILPPLLIGGGVLALMESGGHGLSALLGVDRPGGGDGIWFVPLFATTTEWQRYTMFSAAHILDWGNVHLLISPVGLPLIVMAVIAIRYFAVTVFERETDKDYAYVLGLISGMYIPLTWLWNPDYGGRKDWDLFAPSAFVYTLLAGYLLVHVLRQRQHLREAGIFIIVVSLLHTAAWIFVNTQPLPEM